VQAYAQNACIACLTGFKGAINRLVNYRNAMISWHGIRARGSLSCAGHAVSQRIFQDAFLSRRAFPTTDTELRLIASAAIIGDSNSPVNGYRTPAAIGMPSAL